MKSFPVSQRYRGDARHGPAVRDGAGDGPAPGPGAGGDPPPAGRTMTPQHQTDRMGPGDLQRAGQRHPLRLRARQARPRRRGAAAHLLLLVVLALAGCSDRGAITIDPAGAAAGSVRNILVASGRAPVAGSAVLSGERSSALLFYDFAVSVPPDRDVGTVTFPRSATPDPSRDFLTVSAHSLDGRAAFARKVDARAATLAPDQREAVVFVHGYNMTFAEGLYRQAQISHDFSTTGVSVNFAWPSKATLRAYAGDRESALVARDGLETTLDTLAGTRVDRIVVMAHSMGAHLLMETLRQMAIRGADETFAKLSAVLLVAPDIDVDLFATQTAPLAGYDIPLYIFVSSRDRALRFSSLLRGRSARLGSVTDPGALPGHLPIALIDLTALPSNADPLQHFKVASSPSMIGLLSGMGTAGLELFDDPANRQGLFQGSVELLQDAAGAVLGTPAR